MGEWTRKFRRKVTLALAEMYVAPASGGSEGRETQGSAKGAKPSALLGRSYARRCWAAVAASALAAERGAGDEARAAAAERFLADFARELADDASLAWAADFKEAIRARQLARADDAKARAAAGSSALRGAVADGLAASPEGTVITHMREGEVLHEIEVKPGAGAAGL